LMTRSLVNVPPLPFRKGERTEVRGFWRRR
jgi:hypothetical protein